MKPDHASDLQVCIQHNPMLNPSTRSIEILPPELLSLVFELGGARKDDDGPQYWEGDRFHRIGEKTPTAPFGDCPLSFRTTVSLVCHYWYLVALSTQSLWTTLGSASLDRLQKMSERSGDLLLDVRIEDYLEVELPWVDDFGYPRPAIEQEFVKPFRSLAPRFRSMRLEDVRIDWSHPWILSLSNLTTLELIDSDAGDDVRPSWNQLVALLRSAPGLEKIVLRYVGPFEWDIPDNSSWDNQSITGYDTRPISLPYLTDLVLMEACVEGLLRVLYIPALKRLLFNVNYPASIELLARPASLPGTTAAIKGQYSPLNRIEHLHIVSDYLTKITPSVQMLYDGLHNLKLLQLVLCGSFHSSLFLKFLRPDTPSGQADHDAMVRLPRLETLIVCGIGKYDAVDFISLIREVVRERKEAGFPIKSLYVKGSDLEGAKWLLREHVETPLSFFR